MCERVGIVERFLTGASRPRDGKFAAGIRIPEENVGDGVSQFSSRLPSFENGGDVFAGPRDVERSPVHQNKNYGFAKGNNLLEELLLHPRQFERRARTGLLTHVGEFTENEDADV